MGVVYGCQEVPTHEMWKGQQEHEDARKNVHGRHIWQRIMEERESNTKEDIARKTVGPRLVNCFKLEQMGTTKLRRRSQNEKRQGHACRTFHMKLVENGCGRHRRKEQQRKRPERYRSCKRKRKTGERWSGNWMECESDSQRHFLEDSVGRGSLRAHVSTQGLTITSPRRTDDRRKDDNKRLMCQILAHRTMHAVLCEQHTSQVTFSKCFTTHFFVKLTLARVLCVVHTVSCHPHAVMMLLFCCSLRLSFPLSSSFSFFCSSPSSMMSWSTEQGFKLSHRVAHLTFLGTIYLLSPHVERRLDFSEFLFRAHGCFRDPVFLAWHCTLPLLPFETTGLCNTGNRAWHSCFFPLVGRRCACSDSSRRIFSSPNLFFTHDAVHCCWCVHSSLLSIMNSGYVWTCCGHFSKLTPSPPHQEVFHEVTFSRISTQKRSTRLTRWKTFPWTSLICVSNTKCVYMCVTKCVCMCVTKCVHMCVTKYVYMCVTKYVYMCVTKCVCWHNGARFARLPLLASLARFFDRLI